MRRPVLLLTFVAVPLVAAIACSSASSPSGGTSKGSDAGTVATADAGPQLPLAVGSPWPKFRANGVQNGVGTVHPTSTTGAMWAFQTGKGVFSSPVVAADGTIYVGSADRTFYALTAAGTVLWQLETGEIIDSSALLDDKGNVYFGSGDGKLRALDAKTGTPVWSLTADDPSVNNAYIDWFEGNVGIGMDGTLYVPNDNYFIYAIDRTAGTPDWKFKMPDQTWSLPAVDQASGTLYVGNNNMVPILGANTFAILADGSAGWNVSTLGTVAASPMLTSDGKVVVGAFDGYLHTYDEATGNPDWTFATRDHVYASAALLPDGTYVVASADGSIYGVDPASGAQKWELDTTQPIRSSPSVDADGNIYFGGGDGRLYVLGPNGALRWSILLIDADRNDLNSSPALSNDAIILGGESGQVFSVPYEYCLRGAGLTDARCSTTMPAAADGASLVWTTSFGNALTTPPSTIGPTTPITLTLVVRQGGNAELAIMDAAHVTATLDPPTTTANVVVSGDGKFLTIIPQGPYTPAADGTVTVNVSAPYLTGMSRHGLELDGGTQAGTASFSTKLTVNAAGTTTIDPATTWEMTRLSVPLPTVMPSYNQIGFDSLTYLIGLAELDTTSNHAVAWMVGAALDSSGNASVDPTSKSVFPLDVTIDGATLTMNAPGGLTVDVMELTIPFDSFRMDLALDAQGQNAPLPASLVGSTKCASVPTYGVFLEDLGLCNPETNEIAIVAASNVTYHGPQAAPAGVGTVAIAATTTGVTATLTGSTLQASAHVASVLLVDATSGEPVALPYALGTVVTPASDGTIASVTVPFGTVTLPTSARAYLMIDTGPVGSATLTLP